MGQVVELSDDTYHALAALVQHPPRHQPRETGTEADVLPGSEHPVVLAYQRAPVQRLTGVVRAMRAGDRDLALTDEEWQTLGLEEPLDA